MLLDYTPAEMERNGDSCRGSSEGVNIGDAIFGDPSNGDPQLVLPPPLAVLDCAKIRSLFARRATILPPSTQS